MASRRAAGAASVRLCALLPLCLLPCTVISHESNLWHTDEGEHGHEHSHEQRASEWGWGGAAEQDFSGSAETERIPAAEPTRAPPARFVSAEEEAEERELLLEQQREEEEERLQGHSHRHSHSHTQSLGGGVSPWQQHLDTPTALWAQALGSALLVSLCSVICLSLLPCLCLTRDGALPRPLVDFLASFGAGAILGDAFLHQLPHAFEASAHSHSHSPTASEHHHGDLSVGLATLGGIVCFFVLEKLMRWLEPSGPLTHMNHPHSHKSQVMGPHDPILGKESSEGVGNPAKEALGAKEDAGEEEEEEEEEAKNPGLGKEGTHDAVGEPTEQRAGEVVDRDDENGWEPLEAEEPTEEGEQGGGKGTEKGEDRGEQCKASTGREDTAESAKEESGGADPSAAESAEDTSPAQRLTGTAEPQTGHGPLPGASTQEEPSAELAVVGYLNLLSDAVHNFTDGLSLGSAFLHRGALGGYGRMLFMLAHEIPQEVGDFGILVHSGLSVPWALALNFLSALTALAGTAVALLLGSDLGKSALLDGFTAGGFVYISLAGVLPELHQSGKKLPQAVLQLLALCAGMGVAIMLCLME